MDGSLCSVAIEPNLKRNIHINGLEVKKGWVGGGVGVGVLLNVELVKDRLVCVLIVYVIGTDRLRNRY